MKKKIKGLIFSSLLLAAAIPFAATPVFANSADIYEERYDSRGILVAGGEPSVLEVENEKLYFDIKTFPVYDKEEDYDATVTAEYKFVNPTDELVKTKMGFPAGNLPYYFSDMTVFKPHVYAGESELEVQTRHTYGRWNKDYKAHIKMISDEYYSDAFYNKDLPVTPYKFTFATDSEEDKNAWVENDILNVRCVADLTLDKTKTRYISASSTDSASVMFNECGSERFVYVLGEDNMETLSWETFIAYGGKSEEQIEDAPVTIEKQEQITLNELLLKKWDKESGISELDWYNGIMSQFSHTSVSPFSAYQLEYVSSEDFMMWYAYDFELAPHASEVNKVNVPIFPTHSGNYYYYTYYMSPAKEWASFGSLEVVIRTDYQLANYRNFYDYGYDKVPGGYRMFFEELPESEFEFTLYGDRNEISEFYDDTDIIVGGLTIAILSLVSAVSLAGFIIGMVYLKRSKKSSRTAKEQKAQTRMQAVKEEQDIEKEGADKNEEDGKEEVKKEADGGKDANDADGANGENEEK